jgi:hypothetical protein
MVFTDPDFLVAEFIEPPDDLQVPVVTFFQPALWRMRGHRKISDFHGFSSRRFDFLWRVLLRAGETIARGTL